MPDHSLGIEDQERLSPTQVLQYENENFHLVIALVLIFAGAFTGFALLTGSFWNIAQGNVVRASKLQVVRIMTLIPLMFT